MKRYAWFIPALVLVTAVLVYPALRTLALSFFHLSLGNGFRLEFGGLDNFARLVGDSRFRASLVVTGFFTIVSVTIEFILGLLLALAVNGFVRYQGVVRTTLLVPWTLPTAIIAVLWGWIFNDQYGVLNELRIRRGVLHSPIAWLAGPNTAMAAIIMADVWKTVPFVFIILLAGLQRIPQDLYEALEMDGAGAWAKFRYVTWPYLMPFVFVSLTFRVIQAFSIFDLVYVMTGGGPGGATETVSVYAYQTLMRYLDLGYGSTIVVATVLLLATVALGLYALLVRRYERLF